MRIGNFRNLLKNLSKKRNKPLPTSVMFEITQRCNLRCKFCYLGKQINTEPDMPIEKIFSIIDQLESLGCMEVILLGGEPLIRKDFVQIYKYIKERGMLVTIWTNGTLITPRIADLFKKYPPHHLRISLYAGSPEGYEKISGNRNAFEKIKRGVNLLKKRKIPFTLRSLITKVNFEEFKKMKDFAKRLGVNFHARTCVTSTTNRDFNPKKFKITPEQRDALLKYSEKYIPLKWEDKINKRLKTKGCKGCLHISNDGNLLACILYRKWYNYDLDKMSLREAWEKRLKRKIRIRCPSL